MPFTILLTCVGDEFGPNIINLLKNSLKHDIKVIGTDVNSNAQGRYFSDNFYVVPAGSDENFSEYIASIVAKHKVNLVLPKADEEALSLSKNSHIFETNECILACSPYETIKTLSNKALTYKKLNSNGITTPEWEIIKNLNQMENQLEKFIDKFKSVVIKPIESRGGRGVFIIDSKFEDGKIEKTGREYHLSLTDYKKNFFNIKDTTFPLMIMEKLLPPVHDIDLLAFNGKPYHVVPRRRINSEAPNQGHYFPHSEELVNLGKKIVDVFQLNWLYDADIMFDSDGIPQVLEINPRPSGSLSATIAAGIPILDDLVSLAKGDHVISEITEKQMKVVPYKTISAVRN